MTCEVINFIISFAAHKGVRYSSRNTHYIMHYQKVKIISTKLSYGFPKSYYLHRK